MTTASSTAISLSRDCRSSLAIVLLCAIAVCTGCAAAPLEVVLSPGNDANQTTAVQKAIDRCGEAGGGTVRLEAGTYRCGSIFLKSHVTLTLAKGAIIKGSEDDAD